MNRINAKVGKRKEEERPGGDMLTTAHDCQQAMEKLFSLTPVYVYTII